MSKLAKVTIGLMIITILSKVLGFCREIVLTSVYGASLISDVYITSMSIPTVLFASVGSALVTTFIPLFHEIEKDEGKERALEFSNNVFNIVIVISIIITILGFIFARPLLKVFAMSFTGEKLELGIRFTRIMIFGVIFIGISNIITAWLQLNGKFFISGMIGCPFNICIIIGIIISAQGNIYLLAIGTLVGMVSQFLFQLPFAVKEGYKYKFCININDIYIKKMCSLVIPVFIGVGVNQINVIIDRSLASLFGDGPITILNSANRLNLFVLTIFITSISSVIYPMLSKLYNEDNKEKFAEIIYTSVNSVILLIAPISIGAIVLANPVVKIVFERGAFDSEATKYTALALIFYSIGMIGFGLRDVLGKVFYSLQDTKTPMINGGIAVCLNIVLNLVMIQIIGYLGLSLATSISAILCILLLFKSLKSRLIYFGQDKIIKTTFKSLIASIVMGGATYFVYNTLSSILGIGFVNEVIALTLSIIVGTLVYVTAIVILKVEEVNMILNLINRKLKI